MAKKGRGRDPAADTELLRVWVASFAATDELLAFGDQVPPELRGLPQVEGDEWLVSWRPRAQATPTSACRELEARLPAPLPPLYRRLILSYRYLRVELGELCLLANPPSAGLEGLEHEMFRDPLLSRVLLRHGFIPFGRGGGGDYDPVCFNITCRTVDGDMQVVRLEHEEILCHERIRVSSVLSPSFRQLVEQRAGTS